jgi:Zn-dependent alcohol dehydrogenase
MRAAGITALGDPVEIIELDDLALPAADEILIDVAAAGVGNWDELVRVGNWRVGGPDSDGARDGGGRHSRSRGLQCGRGERGR